MLCRVLRARKGRQPPELEAFAPEVGTSFTDRPRGASSIIPGCSVGEMTSSARPLLFREAGGRLTFIKCPRTGATMCRQFQKSQTICYFPFFTFTHPHTPKKNPVPFGKLEHSNGGTTTALTATPCEGQRLTGRHHEGHDTWVG